ncbi:MAG: hypothetical protein DHS20C15_07890 [Planctomycetota bacterium]|nr:MAG: hypothetical protein DHS20C15_07890 [Planctomycetota bacterium]
MHRRRVLWVALFTLGMLAILWLMREDPIVVEPVGALLDRGRAPAALDTSPSATGASVAQPSELAAPASSAVDDASAELPDGPPAPEVVIAALSGRVLDPKGVPLPGARVTYVPGRAQASLFEGSDAYPYDLSALPQTLTDGAGRFALDVPWTGGASSGGWPYGPDLIMEHADFATTSAPCRGMRGGGHDVGDLRMEAGAWFHGRVVDEHGVALAGVDVAAFVRAPKLPDDRIPYRGALEMALHNITDASGRFRTSGLQPGNVIVEIGHPGYIHLWLTSIDDDHQLYATPGSEQDLGDIVLARGLSVSGMVVDEAGEPVPDAQVVVSPRDQAEAFEDYAHPDTLPWEFQAALDDNRSAKGRSDAAGHFLIRGLEEGSVAVYARAPGLLIGKQASLAAGTERAHVVLPAGGVFEIELVDAVTGEPLPGLSFELHRQAFKHSTPLVISERGLGKYRASPVGPGEHLLVVRRPGYATSLGRLHGLRSGDTREITLRLHPESLLTGRVVDERGAPVEGVSVWASSGDDVSGPFGVGPAADDGTTVTLFTGESGDTTAHDGRFRLDALGPGLISYRLDASDRVSDDDIHTLELAPGEHRDLGDIVLALAGKVQISARQADGSAVGQHMLQLNGELGGLSAFTDVDGRVTMSQLAPGDYTLTADGTEPLPVIVRAGETTHVDVLLSAPPRVFGRVTRAGVPQPGVKIFAREARAQTIWGRMIAERTTHTDADGRYELALPSAEAFHVSATSTSHTRLEVLHDFAWDEQRRVDFVFDSGTLSGTLHAADDGRPLGDIGVELHPVADGAAIVRANTRSSADGRWSFDELTPGAYTLRAWQPDFAFLHAGPFTTDSGEEIALLLQPAAILHGTLTRPGIEMVPDDTPLRLESRSGALLVDDVDRAWTEAGTYRFARLPAGSYRVLVGEPDDVLLEALVDLAAGETRRLDLVLPP